MLTPIQWTEDSMEKLCDAAADTLELKQAKRNWRKCLYHKEETLHEVAERLLKSGWVSARQKEKPGVPKGAAK